MCQVDGKAEISIPHSFHIFQPILIKFETKEDIPNTAHMQNLVDVRRHDGGLRREGIFRYFLFFFVFLLTPTGHTRRPITTVYGSERVFLRKIVAFGGNDNKKIMFGDQNSPKT